MQPINNFQNQSAEYSALETAISLCGDATLKAMMTAKLQGLAKHMSTQTQSSTPQSSFTASTAAAASPSITVSAPKVTETVAINFSSSTTATADVVMTGTATASQSDQKASSDSKEWFKVMQISKADEKEFDMMAKKLDIKAQKESEIDNWYKSPNGYGEERFIAVQRSNHSVDFYWKESYGEIIEKIKESHRTFAYLLEQNQKTSSASSSSAANSKASKEALLKSNPEYRTLSKAWDKARMPIADQIKRLEAYRAYAFGTDQWEKYCGQIVEEIPPLPADLDQILDRMDPGSAKIPGKIGDTHILTLVPKTVLVDGKMVPITLSNLAQLLKDPKNGGHGLPAAIKTEDLKDVKVNKAHWVLLRKEVFTNFKSGWDYRSDEEYYRDQENAVVKYSQLTKAPYQLPATIDASASAWLHRVRAGDPPFWGQVRCLETSKVAREPNSDNWDLGNTRHVVAGMCGNFSFAVWHSHSRWSDNGTGAVAAVRYL